MLGKLLVVEAELIHKVCGHLLDLVVRESLQKSSRIATGQLVGQVGVVYTCVCGCVCVCVVYLLQ